MLYHRLSLLARRLNGHSLKLHYLISLHNQTPKPKPLLEMPHLRYLRTTTEVRPEPSTDERLPPLSAVKFFVGHSIYKGKAALRLQPRHPEFAPLDSGSFKLARQGCVLLEFAPAAGVRQYDWGRKQLFSLSVTEMGTLISLGVTESCEFFHDPFKGKSAEGKVRKVLKVGPIPNGSGHFFNLSVQNKLINMDESIYIPITKAEYTVLTSAFNSMMPYLLGWHTFANSRKPEHTSRANNANPRPGADSEWNR